MIKQGTTYVQHLTVTLTSDNSFYLEKVSEQAKKDLELLIKKGFLDYVNGYMVVHRDGAGNIRKTERHLFD